MKKRRRAKRTLGQALEKGYIKFAGHVKVVGGQYNQMWDARMDGLLNEGAWLMLRREPKNPFDCNAIQVFTKGAEAKVGYIAKEEALRLAPFMDIGVKMAARVMTQVTLGELTVRLYIKR